MLSDKEFDAIRDGARTEIITVGGVEYVTREVFDPRKPDPTHKPLAVSGLQGLVDFLAAHPGVETDVVAHVAGYDRVDLIGRPKGRFHARDHYATASVDRPRFGLGEWRDLETFIITLQACFEDTRDRAALLALLGNITDEQVHSADDDGVTQTVTARKGISFKEQAKVPNPVHLAPFRTFREVAQPLSPFIFRLKSGSPVSAALFEADGGEWKLEAVGAIKRWLREYLPAEVPVIG